jgi:arabinofuranosyltransferase
LLLVASVVLWLGWRAFWFLTDDAYIAFRYVSNSRLGFGYVWNPPPFAPVEGYTSFLWVALLDGVWRLTGIEPPASANVLSLVFAWATLMLVAAVVWRLGREIGGRIWRLGVVAWACAFLLSNRTFLAWTSSGLETALFNLLLVAWILALRSRQGMDRLLPVASLATAGLALTRPDGLLFVVALAAATGLTWLGARHRGRRSGRTLLWGLLPAVVAAAHVSWRLAFYGEWLPNTYAAKITGAWPESGLRYAASFVLEYGLWLPAALLAGVAAGKLRAGTRSGSPPANAVEPATGSNLAPGIALAAVTGHLAFYTFVVGGDVFEYRVYSYLVPLIPVALLGALARTALTPAARAALLAASLLVALPVPWTHYFATREITSPEPGQRIAVAPRWPRVFRWYARPFDAAQAWLIERNIGIRHHEHRQFWLYLVRNHPAREAGARISAAGFPVAAAHAVGVAAWVAPHVNVIDLLGLNDRVVARTPIAPGRQRRMAHSRRPPPGYVESFRPNVVMEQGQLRALPRDPPLTADAIVRLEARWRARVPNAGAD